MPLNANHPSFYICSVFHPVSGLEAKTITAGRLTNILNISHQSLISVDALHVLDVLVWDLPVTISWKFHAPEWSMEREAM